MEYPLAKVLYHWEDGLSSPVVVIDFVSEIYSAGPYFGNNGLGVTKQEVGYLIAGGKNMKKKVDSDFDKFPPLDRTSDTKRIPDKEAATIVQGIIEEAKKHPMGFPDTIMVPTVAKKEKEVCEELKAFWKKDGFYVIRNQQGIGSKKGLADFTVVKDGRVAFVEAKATKGKQSPFQKMFQAGLEAEGGIYILAFSVSDFISAWSAHYWDTQRYCE